MAIIEIKAFGIECDRCKKDYDNYNGFSIFCDKEDATQGAQNDDWLIDENGCYCPNCYDIDEEDNVTIKQK